MYLLSLFTTSLWLQNEKQIFQVFINAYICTFIPSLHAQKTCRSFGCLLLYSFIFFHLITVENDINKNKLLRHKILHTYAHTYVKIIKPPK